jgi:hypothetical protein
LEDAGRGLNMREEPGFTERFEALRATSFNLSSEGREKGVVEMIEKAGFILEGRRCELCDMTSRRASGRVIAGELQDGCGGVAEDGRKTKPPEHEAGRSRESVNLLRHPGGFPEGVISPF